MTLELPPIADAERTPRVLTLLALIDTQQQRLQFLEELVQQLRDEIARLQGQTKRPNITPSQLETPPKKPREPGSKRPGSDKRSKNLTLVEAEEIVLLVLDAPEGAIIRGYEEYVVQELVIEAKATRYLRQRVELSDGSTRLAPLPDDVLPGQHFGPTLIAYVLHQYHQCNVTQPLLLEQLHELGIDISAGQLNGLLTERVAAFHEEKAEILPAGLAVSDYIGVDDTGARHQGRTGFCTAIVNDFFAYFESTDTKSRINFLQVLRGTSTGYTIHAACRKYWKRQHLPAAIIQRLCRGPRHFADKAAWQARLAELDIKTPWHVRLATEGALLGEVLAQGTAPHLVILSDGALQFDALLLHASCWIHIERPLARQVPYNQAHRQALEQVRAQIWQLYQDLKAYQAKPNPAQRAVLEARFDAVAGQKTNYPASIDNVLKEMATRKADLLRVLDRPEVPLHNNATESAIRGYVKTRKISGSTRSAAGRRCRDTFASLKKTCRKLAVSFWAYLQDRIRGRATIPRLADLIRAKAAGATTAVPAAAAPA